MNRWNALCLTLLTACGTTPIVDRCIAAADCADGLVCLGGSCRPCAADSECGEGIRCGGAKPGRCGCADNDEDGSSCDDCDDNDPARFPAASEICDGRDNDCDGQVDEGVLTTWYIDSDGDGFGNAGLSLVRCQAPASFVAKSGDCNDSDPTSYPGRTEVCDARDNNCDGQVDEGVRSTYYRDGDGDGFGDPLNTVSTCQTPSAGFVGVAGDCDDTRADVNPRAEESCNNRDDNCDGAIDGQPRGCSNTCGLGVERCEAGLWQACSAPTITTITSPTTLTGTLATYDCLTVGANGRLLVPADMRIEATGWIRFEGNASATMGARSELVARGEIVFADQSQMLATDVSLTSAQAIHIAQDAKWFAQSPQAAAYSAGGSPACASLTVAGVGGASGGARGGAGGRGGTCGPLITQVRAGIGGSSAEDGTNGCDCTCSSTSSGPLTSGAGGGPLAGGGGAANGGAGGTGGAGFDGTSVTTAGAGGLAEVVLGQPRFGGAGGGSSGTYQVSYAPEACQGGGGAGGGIVRVKAPLFVNQGVLSADGAPGASTGGGYGVAGGGGGGAGGTWLFAVTSFDNRATVSMIGGRGGDAAGGAYGFTWTQAGGGGGGGGGRFFLTAEDGGTPSIVNRGNLFVGGGQGGAGRGATGSPGGSGVVWAAP